MSVPIYCRNGVAPNWSDISLNYTWAQLAAGFTWRELAYCAARYHLHAAFVTPNWATISTDLTWQEAATGYTWSELSTRGAIPAQDLRQVAISRQAADLFERLNIGTALLILDNARGQYSPDRVGGINSLRPNAAVTFKAFPVSTSVHPLFTGQVESYDVRADVGRHLATIRCADVAKLLRRTVLPGLQVDIRTSSLAAVVASLAGLSATQASLDQTMADVVTFANFDQHTAGDAFNDLVRLGSHRLYASGGGYLTMLDRNFDVSTTVVASYVNEAHTLNYALTTDQLYNDVTVKGQPRALSTDVTTIAFLDQETTITASASVVLTLEFFDPEAQERGVPVRNALTPVNSLDFQLNANPDGSGSDLTATASLTAAFRATTAEITIFNGSGTRGFINKLNVRGQFLRRQPAFSVNSLDSASQTAYDKQTYVLESDLISSALQANNYVSALLRRQAQPIPTLRFSLRNYFPDVVRHELLDRFHITESLTGVNSRFLVVGVSHTISVDDVGVSHEAQFDLELADTKSYFRLDVDQLDIGRLGF